MTTPEDIIELAAARVRANGNAASSDEPLPYLARDMPLREREWAIEDRIPMRNVTLLSGDGGVGKTVALMQLAAATVFDMSWLNMRPAVGPVFYLGAEDEPDELRRRFEAIGRHYGATWESLFDAGLRVLSFAGADALLGKPDRDGIIVPTPLLLRVRTDVIALRPRLFIIDPAADVFAGKEIDRAQVRQFITLLRGIAIAADCAVILAAHPSLSGMREGTGLSGSTAWSNSVRARFYLTTPKDDGGDDGDEPDAGLRVLECKKSNYGPPAASIPLRWENGVFVVVAAQSASDQVVAEAMVEEIFLTLLRRLAVQNRNVSDKHSPSYAPTTFARQPEAKQKKVRAADFEAAMERLFTAGRIKVVSDGPPSRQRSRIVEVLTANGQPSNGPSNTPSNGVPTPSNGVCSHTPLIPPYPLEAGKGALEAPPAPTGEKEGIARECDGDGKRAVFRDFPAIKDRVSKREAIKGPRTGDWVIMPDGQVERLTSKLGEFSTWVGNKRDKWPVDAVPDEKNANRVYHPCFCTDVKHTELRGGRFFLNDDGTVNHSGSNDFHNVSRKARLVETGQTKNGAFLAFEMRHSELNPAVEFELPCRVYRVCEEGEGGKP